MNKSFDNLYAQQGQGMNMAKNKQLQKVIQTQDIFQKKEVRFFSPQKQISKDSPKIKKQYSKEQLGIKNQSINFYLENEEVHSLKDQQEEQNQQNDISHIDENIDNIFNQELQIDYSINQEQSKEEDTQLSEISKEIQVFDMFGNKLLMKTVTIPPPQQPTGTIIGSMLQLIIAIFGAGILNIPLSFSYSGIIWSSIQVVMSGLLAYQSNMLLVDSSIETGIYSYMGLCELTSNKFMKYFIKINYVLNNWGYIITYIVLQGQISARFCTLLMGKDAPSFLISPTTPFWPTLLVVFITTPLSMFRNLSSLKYSSLIGFFVTSYIIFTIMIESLKGNISSFEQNFQNAAYFLPAGFFSTMPSVIFAYSCQCNIQDVQVELINTSRQKMTQILKSVVLFASSSYIILGIFGYVMFVNDLNQLTSQDVGGIILNADFKGSKAILVALIFTLIYINFAIPFNAKPCKDSLLDIFQPGKLDSKPVHIMLVCFVCFSALANGLFVTSITYVVQLWGAASAPLINFVFPGIFYLKTKKNLSFSKRIFIFSLYVVVMIIFALFGTLNFFLKFTDKM